MPQSCNEFGEADDQHAVASEAAHLAWPWFVFDPVTRHTLLQFALLSLQNHTMT